MYRYEMHCHTSETSACGQMAAADVVDFYKKVGYDGLCITDHFFNGNIRPCRDLPWEEKVELLMKGYNAAKARGDEIGLPVFFGWEFSVEGTDFLTYGLDKEWLLAHPDCDKYRIREYCRAVHEAGGYVVQAHPFREADYIEMIRLFPREVDAVETYNACRTTFENAMAEQYADNYEKVTFCGSDNHVGYLDTLAVLEIPERAETVKDILKSVMDGKYYLAALRKMEDGDYRLKSKGNKRCPY